MGDGEDEVFVGTDMRGVATLAHDFPATLVLVFGAVGVCRALKDLPNRIVKFRGKGRIVNMVIMTSSPSM